MHCDMALAPDWMDVGANPTAAAFPAEAEGSRATWFIDVGLSRGILQNRDRNMHIAMKIRRLPFKQSRRSSADDVLGGLQEAVSFGRGEKDALSVIRNQRGEVVRYHIPDPPYLDA